MTDADLEILRQSDNQIVRLHLQGGEVVTAKISFLSESEQDVILDIISSTDPLTDKKDRNCAYSVLFKDIVHVEPYRAEIEQK
jgi:hypothetical protein